MDCAICGGTAFVGTRYHTREGECPALACGECGALALDVDVARSDAERVSVRLAIARRAALASDEPSARVDSRATTNAWRAA